MAPESDSEPNARPGSKAAKRFVERARNIGGDPEFKSKLNRAREEWNRDYPDYKITPDVPNMVMPRALEGEDLPLPPRLTQAIRPWHDGSWQPRLEAIHGCDDFDARAEEMWEGATKAFAAKSAWHDRVDLLADEGWSRNLYPNWHGRFALNPARRFVAVCLIWGPDDLKPEEWIDPIPHTALIQTIPFDPTYPPAIPEVFRWRTAFDRLAALLTVKSAEGRPLTPEEGANLIEQAQHHGEQMGRVMSEWAANHDPEGFRFVRLHRGMNGTDWRALRSAIVQSQNATYGENQWADEARRLHSEGKKPIYQVARELGVDRHTVRRWIEEQS